MSRSVAIIVSKGGLDDVYPSFILANGARQSGIEATLFFTFYGLDALVEKKVDKLKVNMAGNASSPVPPMVAGLPGMQRMAATMMQKQMVELDLPGPREFLQILHDAGVKLYACQLAMEMFHIEPEDLIEQVDGVMTVGDFYEACEGAQVLFT